MRVSRPLRLAAGAFFGVRRVFSGRRDLSGRESGKTGETGKADTSFTGAGDFTPFFIFGLLFGESELSVQLPGVLPVG